MLRSNKTAVVILGGLFAYCILFSLRAAAPSNSPQWEYIVTDSENFGVEGINVMPAENNQFVYHPERAQEALNRRGQEGWELVTISQPNPAFARTTNIAVFKRRIDHSK